MSRSARPGAPTIGTIGFRVYLALMLALTVGVPVARALVLWGAGPAAVITTETPADVASGTAAAILICWMLSAAAGSHLGPARDTLPRLDLVHATPRARSQQLGRQVRAAFVLWSGIGAAAGLLVACAIGMHAGNSLLERADVMLVGALGGGAVGAGSGLAALVAQRSRTSMRRAVVACGAGAGVLIGGRIVVDRLADATLRGGANGDLAGAAVLVALAVSVLLGVLALPALLRSLDIDTLRAQAVRRLAVGTALLTADARAAQMHLAAPVRRGRNLRWRPRPRARARGARLIWLRDACGLVRTPMRVCGAVIALVLSGAAAGFAGAASVGPTGTMVFGASAALLAYAATATTARGLRAAAFGLDGPSLLPGSRGRLTGAHLVLPLGLAVACASVGGALAHGAGGAVSGAVTAGISVLASAVAAHQGPVPVRLLAPVQTPAGDAAGIVVLTWMWGAALVAAGSGAILAVIGTPSGATSWLETAAPLVTWGSLMLLALTGWLVHRVRSTRG
ncbi:hypothetical protein GCM10009847_26340 [Leucobacter tardus]|uniref:Uncharacterized protein n=1 Tax=Leucobacter tardus TaxID=501483 RepID=A0A939TK37_9MICO|nr:hypothetical protein [Leucobacter tardus]MBO2989861.1 hypothetical protein [Leucobacter tardus]